MDPRPGTRIRARGLIWEVLGVDGSADHTRLMLRCVDGDMAGLEWDIHVPPEPIEPLADILDPLNPTPLALWRLMHRARVLNALPDGPEFVARSPGRVHVEPYQLVPLLRALEMQRPRLLLADGVGLGKTIQAVLIAAELIARRRVHRILIVSPAGPLLSQWEQETRLRFGLKFTLITNAAELWDLRRGHELGANPFDTVSLCLTALDFAKQDHILGELERSAWDLVIIDEAHHCFGETQNASGQTTDRRRLAEVLARRSDGLLLLTATPHDGHDAHFASLIALLDPSLVDGAGGFAGRAYRRHMIRRMKAHIRDPATGAPLFHRRHVEHVKVDVVDEPVRAFHRALAAFVVPRLRGRGRTDDALAFVSLLKRSVSTVAACVATLRVVVERLGRETEAESGAARRERARLQRAWRRRAARFGGLAAADEDNQAALEIESMAQALRAIPDDEPNRLIRLGLAAEAHDPKLLAMVLEIRLIRARHNRTNVLIYTEYTDSQIAAARALREANMEGDVLTIGGQDDDRQRAAAALRFSENDGLILISTDSLAEGLNLQRRCFHLIHLDLPYNPNRLEQRNGRIDRYGQTREPEIRYLYVPGTFEENLLLHLIAKYEKARAALDVMPDTMGVTAAADDYATPLIGGVSEDPADLFAAGPDAIRTLDRAVSDIAPDTVAELLRDIDRAYSAFDLMAVSHGWHGAHGLNAGVDQIVRADRARGPANDSEDFSGFIGAVIAAEIGAPEMTDAEIHLPERWTHSLDGLPGFDAAASVMRFTRDPDIWHDAAGRALGLFGRAHPLVSRAIRHGCRLPGAVAVSLGDLGLLLTFELEISAGGRAVFREIVAVIAQPDCAPVEIGQWLDPGGHASPSLSTLSLSRPSPSRPSLSPWLRLFASWAPPAITASEQLAINIGADRHAAFISRLEELRGQTASRAHDWLRMKADQLCGRAIAPTADLFGAPDTGPIWRRHTDPATRLIALATCADMPPGKRREANDALETFRTLEPVDGTPGPIRCQPLGMLLLVPGDAA